MTAKTYLFSVVDKAAHQGLLFITRRV